MIKVENLTPDTMEKEGSLIAVFVEACVAYESLETLSKSEKKSLSDCFSSILDVLYGTPYSSSGQWHYAMGHFNRLCADIRSKNPGDGRDLFSLCINHGLKDSQLLSIVAFLDCIDASQFKESLSRDAYHELTLFMENLEDGCQQSVARIRGLFGLNQAQVRLASTSA